MRRWAGFVLILLLSSVHVLLGQKAKLPEIKQQAFTLGQTLLFQSEILGEERQLNIYLPADYQQNDSLRYPVVYLLDGSADEDFIHVAGLMQFANFPWVQLFPPSILVGIANVDRKRDFTFPTKNKKDKEDFPTTGGSAKFIQSIKKEIQPLIMQAFRTNSTRTLIGQSLGGLLATEILFKAPELFSHYMIISPSLWWDDQSLLAYAPRCLANGFEEKISIFIAVGKEGEIMEDTARALAEKLKATNNSKVSSWFHYMGDQGHANILHLAIYKAMELMQEVYQTK